MAKIQDKSVRYFLLKSYVDFMFKSAYRRLEYHGKEKIPQDGAIIYASNHVNTLMDPLAILSIDKHHKVFVARADVFKQPLILKLLTFLKMLPINRIRDGRDSLVKNEEVNDIVVDVLRDKVPFCILPEGTHRTKHSLMSLQKGIFRIALQANDAFGEKMPVYIVPVGLEFGHFFKYRSSLLLQVGEPINVTQFVSENSALNPQQQINMLREKLSAEIKKVILHIPDDTNYDATLSLAQLYGKEQHHRLKLKGNSLINRFTAAKKTISDVENALKSNPHETQELLNKAEEFSRRRHAGGIGMKSVLKSHIRWSLVGKMFLLLLGLPYFIFSAVATSPVTLLFKWMSSKFEDKAFFNTLRFLTALIMRPIVFLLMMVIIFSIFPYMWGILFALLYIPSFVFFHDYLRLIRSVISDVRWRGNKDLYNQLQRIKDLKIQN